MKITHKHRICLAAIAVTAIALLHLVYYFPRTVDDMFIYFRYAENLAEGQGLVYNPGERVEGFSGPLWVAILATGEFLGIGGVTYSKVVAILFLAALFFGTYLFSREHLGLKRASTWVVLFALAFNSYLISWTILGLETPAYLALIVWSALFIDRQATRPSRRQQFGMVIAVSSACLSRPEAPFFICLIFVAVILQPFKWRLISPRIRNLLAPAAFTAATVFAYFLFRRLYFGLWFPHTYYAKGGESFDFKIPLNALLAEGALPSEIISIVGACALVPALAFLRHSLIPIAVFSGLIYFTGVVIPDWMPNQRHYLLFWIFIPMLWAWAADRAMVLYAAKGASKARRVLFGLARAACLSVILITGVQQVQLDSRYSPMDFGTHGFGTYWFAVKTWDKWQDTWTCMNNEIPPHVASMHGFSMGMITQLYRLIEADARPLASTWYMARDIGRVGYLSPVKVFDTDGLFTPDVVQNIDWQENGSISDELFADALSRDIVATELVGRWKKKAENCEWLQSEYLPISNDHWKHLKPLEQEKPTNEQILERYHRALTKLPASYHIMTLYGEGVGAAIKRRVRIVEEDLNSP